MRRGQTDPVKIVSLELSVLEVFESSSIVSVSSLLIERLRVNWLFMRIDCASGE